MIWCEKVILFLMAIPLLLWAMAGKGTAVLPDVLTFYKDATLQFFGPLWLFFRLIHFLSRGSLRRSRRAR